MKKVLGKAAFLLATTLVLGGMALSQDTGTQAPPATGEKTGHRHHWRKGGDENKRLEHLSHELNLTEDQKTKFKPILHNGWQEMQPVRDDSSLSKDQKRDKMKSIHDKYQSDIAGVLTPEQQDKWKNMQSHHREHHGDHHAKKDASQS